jgi:recombination protein RecA
MNLLSLHNVYPATRLLDRRQPAGPLHLERLRGCLTELSCPRGTAGLTLALAKLAEVQRAGEPAAWIGPQSSLFYPPDAARIGVAWESLAIIDLRTASAAGRAADKLLRSGAFGAVVIDLTRITDPLPRPLLGRLLRLAEVHDSALIFLTTSATARPSLSSLISLRVEARWQHLDPRRLTATYSVIKDKRRGPGATLHETYDGPLGLR